MSKPEYVRQLIANTESALALLVQEDQILGYMAKLVALDATALTAAFADTWPTDGDGAETTGVTYAVQFFVE